MTRKTGECRMHRASPMCSSPNQRAGDPAKLLHNCFF